MFWHYSLQQQTFVISQFLWVSNINSARWSASDSGSLEGCHQSTAAATVIPVLDEVVSTSQPLVWRLASEDPIPSSFTWLLAGLPSSLVVGWRHKFLPEIWLYLGLCMIWQLASLTEECGRREKEAGGGH